jgi:hypothetical protein
LDRAIIGTIEPFGLQTLVTGNNVFMRMAKLIPITRWDQYDSRLNGFQE